MTISVSEENATPPSAGTQSDMTAWDLSQYASGTVLNATSTEFQIQIGAITWTFTGANFTYGGNGLLATGMLGGFRIEENGTVYADVGAFAMDIATSFKPFMDAHNTAVFQHVVFFSDDDITGAYHAIGYEGDDQITNAVIAEGGAGDDVIAVLATGATFIDAGADDDRVILTGGGLLGQAFGGAGTDVIMGEWAVNANFNPRVFDFELVGNSTVTGNGAANRIDFSQVGFDPAGFTGVNLYGGGGNDKVFGLDAGISNLFGGAGNDLLHSSSQADILSGGAGDDTTIADAGDDRIDDAEGKDFIRGAGGNDVITVASGNDKVFGNENDDELTTTGLSTGTTLYGGSGNDILRGDDGATLIGDQADDLIYIGGGIETAQGAQGNDTFLLTSNANLSPSDVIDGGTSNDFLVLANTTTPFTVATLLKSVEILVVNGGSIATADIAVANGAILTVQAGSAVPVIFDGSAETNGQFILLGTDLDDTMVGGAGNDAFHAGAGADAIGGGGGNDALFFTNDPLSSLDDGDHVNGGGGNDTLTLAGIYTGANALTFAASTMTNVETLVLLRGFDGSTVFSYDLTLDDGNIAAGEKLIVDTTDLRANGPATVDASGETDGRLSFIGGSAGDTFIGGAGRDTFNGGAAGDVLAGGGDVDRFVYEDVGDSSGAGFDTISGLDGREDQIAFTFAVVGVNIAVIGGALGRSTFDTDLADAVGGGQLAANHAVLFTPDQGFLEGRLFLVVDANGVAGYQGGEDFAIELSGATNLDNLAGAFVVS